MNATASVIENLVVAQRSHEIAKEKDLIEENDREVDQEDIDLDRGVRAIGRIRRRSPPEGMKIVNETLLWCLVHKDLYFLL